MASQLSSMLLRMNFFGHACVASWYEETPNFVLGAMLPDFAGMLGARLGRARDAGLLRGISLHHATDAAFHGLSGFVDLVRRSRQELLQAGLSAGPARAVAHVGIELLIDEVLSGDRRGREAYLGALSDAERFDPASGLEALGGEIGLELRWNRMIRALRARGAPESAAAPEKVAERLARALSSRPRLAVDPAGERLVGKWVVSARPDVVGCAQAIVTELRLRLDAAGLPPAVTERRMPLC